MKLAMLMSPMYVPALFPPKMHVANVDGFRCWGQVVGLCMIAEGQTRKLNSWEVMASWLFTNNGRMASGPL